MTRYIVTETITQTHPVDALNERDALQAVVDGLTEIEQVTETSYIVMDQSSGWMWEGSEIDICASDCVSCNAGDHNECGVSCHDGDPS